VAFQIGKVIMRANHYNTPAKNYPVIRKLSAIPLSIPPFRRQEIAKLNTVLTDFTDLPLSQNGSKT
jgi:hypothetical protein